jgi:hypothetical protein
VSAVEAFPFPVCAVTRSRPGPIPFITAAAFYVAISGWIIGATLHLTGGHFVYALDDPYVTMAIAKNIAVHGVWGVTPYGFSSASSTPLFVLLLAAVYRLFGVSEYAPLALSWGFGAGSIAVAARMLSASLPTRSSQLLQSIVLLAFVLFTPLFAIGTLGMEHSLQVLLTLLFLRGFENDEGPMWRLAVVSALMVGTRYEGLFLAVPAVFFLLLRPGRRSDAIGISAGCALPLLLYAWMSLSHGCYWLPNSVALKGLTLHEPDITSCLARTLATAFVNAIHGFYVSFLLAGVTVMAVILRRAHRRGSETLGVIAIAGCFHLACANVAWAYRYDDYLIAAAVVCAARHGRLRGVATLRPRALAYTLFLLAGVSLTYRAIQAIMVLPQASRSIYSQQWQMARFVHSYYPQGSVAANDIGAINFQSDIHCVDLDGLASSEIFSAKHAGRYSTQTIEHITSQSNVKIAIVYDSWFTGAQKAYWEGPVLPPSWVRMERWRVPSPHQLGSDTISFYAVEPGEAGPLRAHLAAFRNQLPESVIVTP